MSKPNISCQISLLKKDVEIWLFCLYDFNSVKFLLDYAIQYQGWVDVKIQYQTYPTYTFLDMSRKSYIQKVFFFFFFLSGFTIPSDLTKYNC